MAKDLIIHIQKLSVNSVIIIITLTLGYCIYVFDIEKQEASGLPNMKTQPSPFALQFSSKDVKPIYSNVFMLRIF